MIGRLLRPAFSTTSVKIIKDINPKIEISRLSSGVNLYTEMSSFPTQSDLGICFRVGHRDERKEERGSLFNLKQRLFHTNEHDYLSNFEAISRTGCMFDMTLDQELTYYKCQFLQEDFANIVDIAMKLALTPKQIFDSEVDPSDGFEVPETPFAEFLLKSAFSGQLMGNSATEGQLPQMNKHNFKQFQQELFTPHNMAIGYSGLLDHGQIRSVMEDQLRKYPEFLQRKVRKDEGYKFTPGTVRHESESQEINIALVYEGFPWSHPDIGITQIIEKILGSSASWSTGGPGKGMRARTTINMMNKIASIESASGINNHYLYSGLTGLKVSGWAQDKDSLLRATIEEWKNLIQPMRESEFLRGKYCHECLLQLNLQRQADRLEEDVKNIYTVQRRTYQYMDLIERVTKEQLQEYVKHLIFETKPLVVYHGKGASELPDVDWVVNELRK